MDQQKIDQLFREQLGNYEVKPAGKSWSEVESQISKRNKKGFYWVAAAISTIAIISSIFWMNNDKETFTPIASDVNHPILEESIQWEIPAPITQEVEVELVAKKPSITPTKTNQTEAPLLAQGVQSDTQLEEVIQERLNETPILELESKTAVAAAEEISQESIDEIRVQDDTALTQEPLVESESIENSTEATFTAVKITYIASNTSNNVKEEDQPAESPGKFKKFIAFAGKISPGDVLADLKTAKDGLVNGAFKAKDKAKSY